MGTVKVSSEKNACFFSAIRGIVPAVGTIVPFLRSSPALKSKHIHRTMKKLACMLAAGVVALGASAQAAEVYSDEYAVITIPVAAGNNLIGISVEADSTPITTVLSGLDSAAEVKIYNGSGYTTGTASGFSVTSGDAVWFDATEAETFYELGKTVTDPEAGVVEAVGALTPVANPYSASWSLDDLTFSTAGAKRRGDSNKVYLWNGTGYDLFWYKNGTGWVSDSDVVSVPASIGAAQGVFVELGNGATSGTVTFAVPE